jgi:translocation and assembly module TamB
VKRRRLVRVLIWVGTGLAALVLLVVLALAFLIGTQAGTAFLFARLGALLPGTFEVQKAEGRIDSPLTLHGLVYKRPGMEIRIDRIYLEWKLRELLAKRVDVGKLYADGVHVISTPQPNQEPTKLPDLDLHYNIIVRDARVRGLTLGSPSVGAGGAPPAPPTVIDEIDLKTTDISNRVHVDRLAVRSALLRADVSGDVQPQGDYPVDLAVRWEVHPPGPPATAPLAGGGTLKGTLANLRVAQALAAPFDVRIAAVLIQPMRDLRFDGTLAFNGVNPRRLRADLPDLPASGQVAVRGTLARFDSWGAVDGAMDPAGRFHLDYRVARDGDHWQVHQADLALPGTPSRVALRGRVTLPATAANGASNLDLDLTASWRNAAWPPRGKPSFASPQGEAHIIARASGANPAGPAAAQTARAAAAGSPTGQSQAGKVTQPTRAANAQAAVTGGAGGPGGGPPAGSLSSEGTVRAVVTSLGPLAASYRLRREGGDWRLEKLDLTVPGTATQVAVSGSATQRGNTFDLDAGVSWHELAWPLSGPPSVRSRQGQARVAGSLDSFRAQVSAEVAAAPVAAAATAAARPAPPAAGRFTLSGNGSRDRFHIDSLTANLLSGQLQGHGEVRWSPRLAWNLALSGQGIDPAAVRADLPGRLGFDLATRGESQPAGLTGSVDLPRLAGTLRGQPVTMTAGLRLAGPSYDLSRFEVHWGTAQAKASGRLGDRFDLGFDAAAPNLGLVLPSASGSLSTRGHVSGPAKTPRVQASAHVEGLRYGTQSVGAANVNADVDMAAAGPFQLDADLRDVNTGSDVISQVKLQSRGTASRHTLALSVAGIGDYSDARLDLGLDGGISGALGASSTWRGQISRLDLRSSPVGDWSLQQAAALQAGTAAVDLRNLCWVEVGPPRGQGAGAGGGGGTSGGGSGGARGGPGGGARAAGGGRLCASAAWSQAGTWAGQATLTSLPLNLARPLLPPDLTVTGDINGTAEAHGGSRGIASANVDLAPGPGDLRFPAEQGRTATVHFERGTLRAQAGPAGGTASAALTLTGAGTFNAQLRLPRLTQGVVLRDQPLAGTIALHFHNLTFLEGFVPDLRNLAGSLNADLGMAGTVGAPRLTGQARLDGGRAQVPEYGLDVKDIRLAATANGSTTLAVEADARSGPGSVRMTGSTGLMPSAATPLRLAVTGNRFEVMGTRDIRILVTPDVQLEYQGTMARVTGQVTIPEAHVHVEKAPKGGPIEPSKDVVFVGGAKPQAQKTATPLALTTRVRLVVPNPAIELDALGLKGRPYGSILLVENPGSTAATGTGELDIAPGGTFQAYGQNLTIERGRLIFGGPVDDPGLDIRASRLSDDRTVTAGIEAKGTLKQPHISVWSNPVMSQSDALAYVVLGHGLNNASQQEGNRVANAATSLGLAGAGLIAKNIGARFGLEEASIESKGNLNQASLVLGKYLAPHLYVVYGIGLFQPVSTFRIRYIVNSKWTLQAESSTETGADVLYTLERGKTK